MSLVSIVIRTKNEEDHLDKTLSKIKEQDFRYPFEVIVVDSGSKDRTLEIAHHHCARVLSIPEQTFSYGYALNTGISTMAQGDIICCLSAHCMPLSERWLHHLVTPLIEGKAEATYGKQIPKSRVNPFEEVSLYRHFEKEERKRVPFSNANSAFLRLLWEEVHFDEVVPSWEDYLWYLMQKDKHRFLFCPEAMVEHTHPFSIKRLYRRAYNDGKAFRMIKERYSEDLVETLTPGIKGKFRYIFDDMLEHFKYFLTHGYNQYIPLIPLVRAICYIAYARGYRDAKRS